MLNVTFFILISEDKRKNKSCTDNFNNLKKYSRPSYITEHRIYGKAVDVGLHGDT